MRIDYPWLKSRGPIETTPTVSSRHSVSNYPWLKSRGPIETSLPIPGKHRHIASYPWLKSRGPIETHTAEREKKSVGVIHG